MTPENSNPQEIRGPSNGVDSNSWVMKSLNDLRDDMKEMNGKSIVAMDNMSSKLLSVETQLTSIESKISKLVWSVIGAGTVLGLLFGGFELLTAYFDITLTPKN